jgi:OOP family OmpA-OmpF porin
MVGTRAPGRALTAGEGAMAVNLLDLFSRSVTPDAVQGISKLLGEDPSAVKGGVAALVPVLLGAFASKASTPSGAASLFSMINSSDVDTGVMSKIGNVVGTGGSDALSQQGSDDRCREVTDWGAPLIRDASGD